MHAIFFANGDPVAALPRICEVTLPCGLSRDNVVQGEAQDVDFRDCYFDALGTREQCKLKEISRLAHDIRRFEIELYWKRATYFWAGQLIAFAALGLLFKDGRLNSGAGLLVPAPIGVITAFAGYLTARGSKFWQENWEAHVDLLEEETQERLTQVIVGRERPQFSVSRINQCLLLLLMLGWSALLLIGAIPQATTYLTRIEPVYRGVGATLVVAIACGWMWVSNRTRLSGRVCRLGQTGWAEYTSKSKGKSPFIIWRDPLTERAARLLESVPDTK